MANFTQEELLDAQATIISGVQNVGAIITDKRFTEDDIPELIRILKSQNAGVAKGVIITWDAIVSQRQIATSCKYEIVHRYNWDFIYAYTHEEAGGLTSLVSSYRVIEGCNDALNALPGLNLGLDNRVRHSSLQSRDSIGIVQWGDTPDAEVTHHSPFSLEVMVELTY